jgi:hypothetical protein
VASSGIGSFACRSADVGQVAGDAKPPTTGEFILSELRSYEASRRGSARFLDLPPSQGQFGADPYALSKVSDGVVAGVLRGSSELVLMDARLRLLQRVPAPEGTIGVVAVSDHLFVVGVRSNRPSRCSMSSTAARCCIRSRGCKFARRVIRRS